MCLILKLMHAVEKNVSTLTSNIIIEFTNVITNCPANVFYILYKTSVRILYV